MPEVLCFVKYRSSLGEYWNLQNQGATEVCVFPNACTVFSLPKSCPDFDYQNETET